ncbi:MAG: M48 family metalloprotease [Solirubrobacterales bacterium]
MPRPRRLAALAIGLAVALGACDGAQGREGFNLVSPEQEQRMGQEGHAEILKQFGGPYDDPDLQAYVAGVGTRLAKFSQGDQRDFRFTVLDSDVVNAMALPGGYVYVTRGLVGLADNEAELAGVLAHEIGHVQAHHTAQRVTRSTVTDLVVGVLGAVVGQPGVSELAQLGAAAWLQGYSRDQEREADSLGIRTLAATGYDPRAMATMLDKMLAKTRLDAEVAGRDPNSVDQFDFFASHPRTAERVQEALAEVAGAPSGGALGRDELLARVDGLLYGGDPKEGVVRGHTFLHPGLGIRFDVPQGFRLVNGEDAVIAQHPSGSLLRFDLAKGSGDMAAYVAHDWGGQLGLREVQTFTVSGMRGATGLGRAETEHGPADVRLVAIARPQGGIYRFLLVTPPGPDQYDREFQQAVASLRPLTAEDKALIRAQHIKVVTVKAGDTAESLAEGMAPADRFRLERFRVLNGLAAGQGVRPGQKVKLVVAG